jgi:hypothetical protein
VADPDPATQQLIAAASQVLSGDQLTAFMAVADAKRFAGDDGTIDADKVSGHLRTLFHVDEPQQAPRNWGQHSAAGGPVKNPGDDARIALEKRHNVKPPAQPDAGAGIRPGADGRAALQRRHGGSKR